MKKALVVLPIAMALMASQAQGAFFVEVTSNSSLDLSSQLQVEVSDPAGDNNVLLTFRNLGPEQSSVADIFFDIQPGILTDPVVADSSPGASFSTTATDPGVLPGGNNANPPFVGQQPHLGATAPPPENGLNPGEFLSVLFTLPAGVTPTDIENLLNSGAFRVGMHVIGLEDGESESYVTAVPEPTTYLAIGFLLLPILHYFWRSRLDRVKARMTIN